MKRRALLLKVTFGLVATLLIVATPAIADTLLGALTRVDSAAGKAYVIPTDQEKEVEVLISKDTVWEVTKKGETTKATLEEVNAAIEKSKGFGKKGANVEVTHEKNKASKVVIKGGGKKAA